MRARFAPIVGVLGLSVAACDTRPTSPATGPAKPAFQTVDFVNETHFRCYTVSQQTPQPATTVTLSDQFISSATLSIDEPLQFCAPTSKNGGAINAPEEHLTMYGAAQPLPTGLTVSTEDQFRTRTLTAVGARVLLVPTEKNSLGFPANLNHDWCYAVTGPAVGEQVTLEDQFSSDTLRVEHPRLFCNPVEKTVGAVTTSPPEPDVHLTCYEIKGPQRTEATKASIENQFETDTFTVTSWQLLCVPAAKLGVEAA